MAELIIITGGKGGVGKSTVCVGLGQALSQSGSRVLLIETGQRALDVFMGRDDVMCDVGDLLAERCAPRDAVLHSGQLDFICAPANGPLPQELVTPARLEKSLTALEQDYDYILAEVPMQEGLAEAFAALAERAVIVCTPDRASARGGRMMSDLLAKHGVWDIRLCVNQLLPDFHKTRPIPDLDWLIDTVCAQLICIVPFSQELLSGTMIGNNAKAYKTTRVIFDNFAQRIIGRYIDLLVW